MKKTLQTKTAKIIFSHRLTCYFHLNLKTQLLNNFYGYKNKFKVRLNLLAKLL